MFAERIDARPHRLYITEVQEADSGQYTCKAYLNGADSRPNIAHSWLHLDGKTVLIYDVTVP